MLRPILFLLFANVLSGMSVETGLISRQSTGLNPSDIPSQCNSACVPLISEAENCGLANTTCICSTSVRSSAVNCAVCIVKIAPSNLVPLQEEADSEVKLCQQANLPVPAVNLTAILMMGNDNSSSSLPSSSTQTGSSPAPTGSSSIPSKTNGAHRPSLRVMAPLTIFIVVLSTTFL